MKPAVDRDRIEQMVRSTLSSLGDARAQKPLPTGDAISVDPKVVERYRKATIPPLEALWSQDGKQAKAHNDPRLAFGQAQVLILNQIATGEVEHLPELLPEIVYLAVSPYGGHEEALKQSQLARESTTSGAVLR